jgi:hypothetical protein
LSLFKPDFEHWKPHKAIHQYEMRVAHGFEIDDARDLEKQIAAHAAAFENQVIFFKKIKYFQNVKLIYFLHFPRHSMVEKLDFERKKSIYKN